MKTPLQSRGRAQAQTLAVIVTLGMALLGPATAAAVRDASYSEGHQQRVEERLARRAQRESEREARRTEREQRRSERAQRRAARIVERQERHDDREAAGGESEAPTGSAQPSGCRLTIAAGSAQVLAGTSATLSGSASCATETDLASAPIEIYENTKGSRPRVALLVKTLTASGDGSFTTTSGPLTANTVFEARLGTAQASVRVRVAPAVTLTASAATETGTVAGAASTRLEKTAFAGTVTPAAAGMLVALQIASATGQRWHTIGWTHTAADGTYSIERALHSPGTTSVRTLVHPRLHLSAGVSETLSLHGARPQRPGLTIATSEDPVVEGQPVQITGSAAGAPGLTVKLLGRTAAGWTVLGVTTTDEAGGYSFETTPQETILYRVTDGTTTSKLLKQQVAFAVSPEATPATAFAGEAVTFAGAVAPAPAGTQVELEALGAAGVAFHLLATGTVGSAQGYSISHAFAAGIYTLRIRVLGNWAHPSTSGAPFVLTVSPGA
jgi:hypothetical protein